MLHWASGLGLKIGFICVSSSIFVGRGCGQVYAMSSLGITNCSTAAPSLERYPAWRDTKTWRKGQITFRLIKEKSKFGFKYI